MTAKNRKMDLILHPIRMQILMALTGEQKTARQLADILREVPQATLYRHINRLAEGGLIQVAAERKVRGNLEKVYTVDSYNASLNMEEMAAMSKDDHLRFFIAFTTTLLDDFSRYLQRTEKLDITLDKFGYYKFPLELTNEELGNLVSKMNEVFAPLLANQPGPGRRRRIFSTILIPDVHEAGK